MGVLNSNIPDISKFDSSVWFQILKPVHNPALKLFCFSYAGGNASAYRDWYQHLPDNVQVCAVQLPGRGPRFNESLHTSMESLLDDLQAAITPSIDTPYAFFGHSMGAQVAYELTKRFRDNNITLPDCLFVSGRSAPQSASNKKQLHDLPEEEFLEEIRRLNGTSDELFENKELMELISPILRADCAVIENCDYEPSEPLDVPVVAFGGSKDDNVNIGDLAAWEAVTNVDFNMRLFSGDHFFIQSSMESLLECISNRIDEMTSFKDSFIQKLAV